MKLRDDEPMIELEQHRAGMLVACAFRYALTRHTYVAGVLADEVQRLWRHLSVKDRAVIKRDLDEHIKARFDQDMADATTAMDMREWVALQCWIEEQV